MSSPLDFTSLSSASALSTCSFFEKAVIPRTGLPYAARRIGDKAELRPGRERGAVLERFHDAVYVLAAGLKEAYAFAELFDAKSA